LVTTDETRKIPGGGSGFHGEIEPEDVTVRDEFLYDMDPKKIGRETPGVIFAVSSYEGSVPTLMVRLADGSVFSYLPPHAVFAPRPCLYRDMELGLEDLVYHNCPAGKIAVDQFEFLKGPVLAYLKRKNLWIRGYYLATIDWYEGNDLLHLVELENKQFAFLPHHKLKFGSGVAKQFEPYKKMRSEWKV
jgi:hypothetical protein